MAALLSEAASRFLHEAGQEPWQVIWCANSSVLGTSSAVLQEELDALAATLDALVSNPRLHQNGAFFFPSSVGGVYAGVPGPPFDEFSPVKAIAPYGFAKLEAEQIVTRWSRESGVPALIGRITNLYGPGQNLQKPQGLISQVCVAHLKRRPITLWVSLDTRRDYVYARDSAEMILAGLDRLRSQASEDPDGLVVTKVMGSGRTYDVAAVLGELQRVFRRKPPVVMAESPVTAMQVSDLSVRSRVWPELDRRVFTTLPAGMSCTLTDLRARQQHGLL